MTNEEFLMRFMKATARARLELYADIGWKYDNDKLTIFAICPELFGGGCEDITPENIYIFEETFRQCKEFEDGDMVSWASALFCLRVSKRSVYYPNRFEEALKDVNPKLKELLIKESMPK